MSSVRNDHRREQVTWDRDLNLTAYEAVEAISNYVSQEDLDRYRTLLFEKSQPVTDFIADRVFTGIPLKVVELCAGSSRVLYSMEKRGLLDTGYGVEISPSRHAFAEDWKRALGATRTTNIQQSVGDFAFERDDLNLVIMIDGALSYLYPSDPELPEKIIEQAYASLAPGGALLMEFDVLEAETLAFIRRHGHYRTYNAGDEKDPFSYALYHVEAVDQERMVFKNTSTYLNRITGKGTIKEELYKFFDAEELSRLLGARGFAVKHLSSFSEEPFSPSSSALVTLAVKS